MKNFVHGLWRALYPILIYLVLQDVVLRIAYWVLFGMMGIETDDYSHYSVLMIGMVNVVTILVFGWIYDRDRKLCVNGEKRKLQLNTGRAVFLFLIGASLCRFGNMGMDILRDVFPLTQYQEMIGGMKEGHSLLMLIFWIGLVCPVAEELLFRGVVYRRLRECMSTVWAVLLSGVLFGIYHGNLEQGIYSAVLGFAFAWFVEITGNIWSSIFLHMGANILGLTFSFLLIFLFQNDKMYLMIPVQGLLMAVLLAGAWYFWKNRIQAEHLE